MLSWIGFFVILLRFLSIFGEEVCVCGGGGTSFFMCGGRDLGGGFFLLMFVMFQVLNCNVLFMISFLFSVEQENDLLVCGVCQTNFPLQDIIKFIRHKVTRCNKENVDVETSEFEDGEDPDPESLAISSKRTSISAPITRKEQMESRLSPRPSSESNLALKDAKLRDDNSHFNVFSDRDRSARSPFRTSTNDISCNTEITGRSSSQIDK